MKRCEDSGLWVPGPGGGKSVGEDEEEEFSEEEEEEEAGQTGGEGTEEAEKLPLPSSPPGDGSGEAVY